MTHEWIGHERGLSLVELLVVVLVVTILVAISIPVFLGAQQRTRDRAAQSMARMALVAAKTIFQTDEDFTAATVTRLKEAEPGLTFLAEAIPSSGPNQVSTGVPSAEEFVAAVFSLAGRCFYIRDLAVPVAGGGTSFGVRDPSQGPDCLAADTADITFQERW